MIHKNLTKLLSTFEITTVIDVGANIGQFGLSLRSSNTFFGRLISFEPQALAFDKLTKCAASDPLWYTAKYGLGDQDGRAHLNISENSVSSSILTPSEGVTRIEKGISTRASEIIEVRRLDGLAHQLDLENHRSFLKIDVQGFEKAVIRGAMKSLGHIPLIQMELGFFETYTTKSEIYRAWSIDEAVSEMRNLGYRVVGIADAWSNLSTGEVYEADFLFARGLTPVKN